MSQAHKKTKISRDELKPGENLCDHCTAKCCRYFALPIETPEDWRDYEYIRWYLLHERASVFVDEGDWYLMVHTVCKHLGSDHLCGIYETLQQICREYSTDNCEYEDDWTYEQYFETPEQVYEYAEAILPPRRADGYRSRKPTLLPVIG